MIFVLVTSTLNFFLGNIDLSRVTKEQLKKCIFRWNFSHSIGQFNLKISSLRECPKKWLDRKLDEGRVEEIARSITANPASMHNAQPWLAIADVTKEDVVKDKNVIKGANIQLIGGLHRHAACKKVLLKKRFEILVRLLHVCDRIRLPLAANKVGTGVLSK